MTNLCLHKDHTLEQAHTSLVREIILNYG